MLVAIFPCSVKWGQFVCCNSVGGLLTLARGPTVVDRLADWQELQGKLLQFAGGGVLDVTTIWSWYLSCWAGILAVRTKKMLYKMWELLRPDFLARQQIWSEMEQLPGSGMLAVKNARSLYFSCQKSQDLVC